MPNNNNFIPKENIAKVEEVREMEEKELITPEEQAKLVDYFKERQDLIIKKSNLSPAARSKVIRKYGSDYLSERAFTRDIALMEMYGPGFWDDIKVVVKPIASGALIAASIFPPTAAIALPITATVVGTGAATMGLGHITDSKGLKEFGKDIIDVAANGFEGQQMVGDARDRGVLPRLKE